MLLSIPRAGRRAIGIPAVSFVIGLWAPPSSGASDLSVRPIFATGVGYDSNVFLQPSGPTDDYFGTAAVQVPVAYKIGPRSGLTGNYLGVGEWYRDLTQLDKFPTRQSASVGYRYNSGRKLALGLGGSYSESQRPEEVFPESGVQFGRGRARSVGGNAFLDRKLTRRDSLGLTYSYGRSLYLEDERADSHTGTVTLGRELSHDSRLDVRYLVQHYAFHTDDGRDTSQAATVGWSKGLTSKTSLRLRAGARFVGGSTSPEAEASLTHGWRRSSLTASYSRTRTFVPAGVRFADTDWASLAFTRHTRSFLFTVSPSYYRSRADGRDFDSFHGTANTVYMVKRWLGLGATYLYTNQRQVEPAGEATSRHLARVGFVVSPWAGPEPQGLP
jgi:hypothetical protein